MRTNILTLLLFMLLPALGIAQFQAGEWFLNGEVGLSLTSNRDFDFQDDEDRFATRVLSLEPTVGWFLTDNLALLFGLDYTNIRSVRKSFPANMTSFDNKVVNRQQVVSFMPGLAFVLPFTDKFGVFLEGNIGMGFGGSKRTEEDDDGNLISESKEALFRASTGVYPVAFYRISDMFMLQAGLGGVMYELTRTKPIVDGDTNEREVDHFFGFSADSFLSIGFSWFFVSAGPGGE